ncbi:hypothetical protein ACFYXH_42290 [Streptomyces sp. NPDC002730]|uniref:hypothetical protein n=1 Tax=Streptomyces sp. NPDC002730 TaxID=3364662 RepID=UPI003699F52F
MTTPPGSVGSCRYCLAWGVIAFSGMCHECVGWRVWDCQKCGGCHRAVPLKHGHCRLCHRQALRQLGRMVIRETMPNVDLAAWQLFLVFPLGPRGRHTHPKASPETPAEPAPSTGIDYLKILDKTHTANSAKGINYSSLLDDSRGQG